MFSEERVHSSLHVYQWTWRHTDWSRSFLELIWKWSWVEVSCCLQDWGLKSSLSVMPVQPTPTWSLWVSQGRPTSLKWGHHWHARHGLRNAWWVALFFPYMLVCAATNQSELEICVSGFGQQWWPHWSVTLEEEQWQLGHTALVFGGPVPHQRVWSLESYTHS
jgi:hypothetical protein